MDVSIEYGRANPDFQPFSVYNKYPGSELLRASSPDDFVWHLISEFGRLGVTLHPVLAPKRVRMVLFSNRVPDTLQVRFRNRKSEVNRPLFLSLGPTTCSFLTLRPLLSGVKRDR